MRTSEITKINVNSNNNNFKIQLNNTSNNNPIFDVFYISPNIVEINQDNNDNYIHEKIIEKIENIYDKTDIEYFPINYTPSGIPIELKNNTLIIENIKWNIIQNISDSKFDEINLLGMVPFENKYNYINTELEVTFELHSQIPFSLLNNRENIIVYRTLNHKNKFSCSNTCLFSTENTKIKINNLNDLTSTKIEIPLLKHAFLSNALLCVKVGISNESVYQLRGFDKFNNMSYGFVPFSQFVLSFDYRYK
jgi:hypothetical protein